MILNIIYQHEKTRISIKIFQSVTERITPPLAPDIHSYQSWCIIQLIMESFQVLSRPILSLLGTPQHSSHPFLHIEHSQSTIPLIHF